jgi:predicted small secreted protein
MPCELSSNIKQMLKLHKYRTGRMNKGVTLIVMGIVCVIMVTACNTMHGLGKDIESLGHAMKKTADRE